MPDRDGGSVSLADFLDEVADEPAFVRASIIKADDSWTARHLDVVVGQQLPSDQPAVWRYRDVVFIAEPVDGEELRRWFHAGGAGALHLASYSAAVPKVWESINFNRQPSRPLHSTPRLPWPHVVYEIGSPEDQPTAGTITGHLVGEDCPSFPSYDHAAQAFFRGLVSLARSPMSASTSLARVRVLQQDAWLSRISVTPTHIEVIISGSARHGARLELNGSTGHATRRVGARGRVRLPLAEGLPDDAWLYLSRGGAWLDYRAVGTALGGAADDTIDRQLTSDPSTEIRTLLAVGEGPQIEYKLQLPDGTTESKRKVLKTVAAFANDGGGHILFGMDPDETTLKGLSNVDPKEARDRLGRLIRGNVVPPDPTYTIQLVELDHRLVIALQVEPSPGRPYGLQFQDRPVEFYVRRGSSTFAATVEEVRSLSQPPLVDRYPPLGR